MANATSDIHNSTSSSTPANAKRRKLLIGIAGVVIIVGVSFGIWNFLVGSHHVETDNAYVGADTAQITPMVSGQVAQVLVSDAQTVKQGDVLVRIDDSDARIALASAEAALAKSKRQFAQTSATGNSLSSQLSGKSQAITGAKAMLTAAQAAFDKAQIDLDRRKKLAPNGAVSADELTIAVNAYAAAESNLHNTQALLREAESARGAAQGTLAANDALIAGTTVVNNPDVLAAQARVDQAQLDLTRTVVRAPIDGIVTSRAVQVGQRVAPGSVVMRVVPVQQLYVDANYKEVELTHVQQGQKVTLTSDMYGSDVVYHGTVTGFQGGTGSAFALIPAQNATGNWIKIVQRLPVRIALDPKELAAHPLRVGLSMNTDIKI